MSNILDGKKIANDIKHDLREQVVLQSLTPALAIILVGNDAASELYIKLKIKACRQIGIEVHEYRLPAHATQTELLQTISFLNQDTAIDAILLQLPLPTQLDANEAIQAIHPDKDADGFHPANIAKLSNNATDLRPAPAEAVIRLIQATETDLQGLQAVVIANTDIFFQPISILLGQHGVTVDYIHPTDADAIAAQAPNADIVIVAIGKPHFITTKHVKADAVVIDVGTNRVDNTVVGDVDFETVKHTARAITPVPGGVGPVTIACLLENVIVLHQNHQKKRS